MSTQVARKSNFKKSVHIYTDDFYHYLSKGAIPPYLPESGSQNAVVMEAVAEAAKAFSRGGYDVIVDGIVGPWFLPPWHDASLLGHDVHYIILRADKDETMRRAVHRDKLDHATNARLVETMWEQFNNLGQYEPYVIDTTNLSSGETLSRIQNAVEHNTHLL